MLPLATGFVSFVPLVPFGGFAEVPLAAWISMNVRLSTVAAALPFEATSSARSTQPVTVSAPGISGFESLLVRPCACNAVAQTNATVPLINRRYVRDMFPPRLSSAMPEPPHLNQPERNAVSRRPSHSPLARSVAEPNELGDAIGFR